VRCIAEGCDFTEDDEPPEAAPAATSTPGAG
jgi:hypothetical protein